MLKAPSELVFGGQKENCSSKQMMGKKEEMAFGDFSWMTIRTTEWPKYIFQKLHIEAETGQIAAN